MEVKKINKETILSVIEEEAYIYRRKKELYEAVKKITAELKDLNECRGVSGTFGFQSANDGLNKATVGGFQEPQDISHLAQLERDFGMEDQAVEPVEDVAAEVENLKAENEMLKTKLAELSKPQIQQ